MEVNVTHTRLPVLAGSYPGNPGGQKNRPLLDEKGSTKMPYTRLSSSRSGRRKRRTRLLAGIGTLLDRDAISRLSRHHRAGPSASLDKSKAMRFCGSISYGRWRRYRQIRSEKWGDALPAD